jgi:HEAT repeat protein
MSEPRLHARRARRATQDTRETGPGSAARELVSALAEPGRRDEAFRALLALGAPAREAIREGLGDGRFEVRRWCVVWLLHLAEPEDAPFLLPLLHDPKSVVRHAAVVALSQQPKLQGEGFVPRLMERALHDDSLRVRRAATLLLGWTHAHPDLEGFFAGLAARESDAKLQRRARLGMRRCRERAAEREDSSC